jgi:hypothetical protein
VCVCIYIGSQRLGRGGKAAATARMCLCVCVSVCGEMLVGSSAFMIFD